MLRYSKTETVRTSHDGWRPKEAPEFFARFNLGWHPTLAAAHLPVKHLNSGRTASQDAPATLTTSTDPNAMPRQQLIRHN